MPIFFAPDSSSIGHGAEVYPVVGGKVSLPDANWYADLVNAGMLIPVPPTPEAGPEKPAAPSEIPDESGAGKRPTKRPRVSAVKE